MCAAVPAAMCWEVLGVDSVLGSAEAQDGQWGCARSCELRASREELRGTLPAALPRGSLAAEQDTALCLLQGLLSLTWFLPLASWHLRCARAALQSCVLCMLAL